MAYEHKPGSGSLFPEKDRKTDKHPNAKGVLVCPHCETQLRLSSWTRTTDGRKWMSIVAQTPTPTQERKPSQPPSTSGKPEFDDDIPF